MARAEIYDWQWWHKMAGATGYSAERLAKEMNISRRQLQRYTQQIFGLSPQEWLNQERLVTAGDLLRQHRSVKLVAFSLGFKQVSHFSREFKSQYGLCPVSFLLWHDQNHQWPADDPHPLGPPAPPMVSVPPQRRQLNSPPVG